MKNYYKIMLDRKSKYADECLAGNFIGADYSMNIDLTNKLYEDRKDSNHELFQFMFKGLL
jgi:restriction system protein